MILPEETHTHLPNVTQEFLYCEFNNKFQLVLEGSSELGLTHVDGLVWNWFVHDWEYYGGQMQDSTISW